MTVKELMTGKTPNPDFEGFDTHDDWVPAVDIGETPAESEGDYVVAQMGVAGLDAQMNPITQDKQYIRACQSSTKTGTQRTFKVTGDRYVGDAFQDYCFSHKVKYGVGEAVSVDYIYFNILNGQGEKGRASIIVNSDGGGNSGENAAVDLDVKKTGALPEEYTYTPAGA